MKVLLVGVLLGWSALSVHAQGPLGPPGPPAPTMKSLQQVEPRIDVLTLSSDGIASRAITAPGSYYLSGNLVGAAGLHGINIKSSNVRLDLNGFTLSGVADRFAIMSSAGGLRGLEIFNGHLTGWQSGLDFYTSGSASNVIASDLHIELSGLPFANGIVAHAPLTVRRCDILNANPFSSAGISGAGIGRSFVVENCRIKRTGGGILLGDCAVVRNCIISECTSNNAISVSSEAIVADNTVVSSEGIRVGYSSQILRNTVRSSIGSGIRLAGSNNRVEDNHVLSNAGYGIATDNGTVNNLVIRNFASGNGGGNYGFLGSTIYGPFVVSSGVIATNNPWSNFSF